MRRRLWVRGQLSEERGVFKELTHAAVVSARRATGIQGALDVVEALFEGGVVGVDFEAFLALGVVSMEEERTRWDLLGEYGLFEFSEPM
jgi:hypothetical protein